MGLLLATLTACGADADQADPDHQAVSAPPGSTATASATTGANPSGVEVEPLDPLGFGMHVNQPAADAWPDVPIGSFRLWNADMVWGQLEKRPGSWTFDRLDQRVANAEERGAPVLLVLSHPPTWAATRPDLRRYGGSPSPPQSVDAWRTYVRTVAERYAGRVEAYEIWNEPNLEQFYVGTPEQLGELTTAASEEIRAADPEALVVSSGFSARTEGSQDFFRQYVAAFDPAAVDVVGIHIYPYPGNGPESLVPLTEEFRTIAADAGYGDKPMWNTEIGYGRTPDQEVSGDAAAALVLRTYLALPARGLERNYWYMWDDRSFVGLFLVESDRLTPSDAGEAYATAYRWLAGAGLGGCDTGEDQIWTCTVVRDGVPLTVVWSETGSGTAVAPAGSVVQLPFTGTSAPVEPGAEVTLGWLPVLFAPVEVPELEG